jgi:hypothetical protein
MQRQLMAASIPVTQKKKGRGRPATGQAPHIALRMPAELFAHVDAWALSQETGRSQAIRRLIEMGLIVAPRKER